MVSSMEDAFRRQIEGRYQLWETIIDDSGVHGETKEKMRRALSDFKQDTSKKWTSLDDAFYGTISSILTITNQDEDKNEGKALFENIRDDMWALFEEIKR